MSDYYNIRIITENRNLAHNYLEKIMREKYTKEEDVNLKDNSLTVINKNKVIKYVIVSTQDNVMLNKMRGIRIDELIFDRDIPCETYYNIMLEIYPLSAKPVEFINFKKELSQVNIGVFSDSFDAAKKFIESRYETQSEITLIEERPAHEEITVRLRNGNNFTFYNTKKSFPYPRIDIACVDKNLGIGILYDVIVPITGVSMSNIELF